MTHQERVLQKYVEAQNEVRSCRQEAGCGWPDLQPRIIGHHAKQSPQARHNEIVATETKQEQIYQCGDGCLYNYIEYRAVTKSRDNLLHET